MKYCFSFGFLQPFKTVKATNTQDLAIWPAGQFAEPSEAKKLTRPNLNFSENQDFQSRLLTRTLPGPVPPRSGPSHRTPARARALGVTPTPNPSTPSVLGIAILPQAPPLLLNESRPTRLSAHHEQQFSDRCFKQDTQEQF